MTKRDEHAKIKRLLTLMRLLNSKKSGMTILDLSVMLRISIRSVHRYLSSLENIGVKIERYNVRKETYYHMVKSDTDHSELLDFLPELSSFRKEEAPELIVKQRKKPVWIYTNKQDTKTAVYDSAVAMIKVNGIQQSSDVIYEGVKRTGVYEGCDYVIVKAPFLK